MPHTDCLHRLAHFYNTSHINDLIFVSVSAPEGTVINYAKHFAIQEMVAEGLWGQEEGSQHTGFHPESGHFCVPSLS